VSYVIQVLNHRDEFFGVITSREPLYPENDEDFQEFVIDRNYLTAHEFDSKSEADRIVRRLNRNPYLDHFSLEIVDLRKVETEQVETLFRFAG